MDLPFYPRLSFGPSEPDLCFGLVWRGLGVALAHHSFGLGEWDSEPISLSPSILFPLFHFILFLLSLASMFFSKQAVWD